MPRTLEEQRAHDAARVKKWREANHEHYLDYQQQRRDENPQRHRDYTKKWRDANPAAQLVVDAHTRANRQNIPFDLYDHIEDIKARHALGVCEMSGLPFEKGIGVAGPLSASIDRIKPDLGYVYSNIRIICLALNRAFSDWGEEELFRIVDAVRAKIGQTPISTT